jgi:hypothetical protein
VQQAWLGLSRDLGPGRRLERSEKELLLFPSMHSQQCVEPVYELLKLGCFGDIRSRDQVDPVPG